MSSSLDGSTLASFTDRFAEGLSGEGLLTMVEYAQTVASAGFLELVDQSECEGNSNCRPVYESNLRAETAHPSVMWRPSQWIDLLQPAAARFGLVVGNAVLVRTTDGVFSSREYFRNAHGFWYSILPAYGCYKSGQPLRAAHTCEEGEKRRWYIFVATRGTMGATEVMADIGLFERSMRREFMNLWQDTLLSTAEAMFSSEWIEASLASMLGGAGSGDHFDFAQGLNIAISAAGVSALETALPPSTAAALQSGASSALRSVRQWSDDARDIVKHDAGAIVTALLEAYGPEHIAGITAGLCAGGWMVDHDAAACPEAFENIDANETNIIFTGHSFGGAAAQLQGILAVQTGVPVDVAVVGMNSPGVHYLARRYGIWQDEAQVPNDRYKNFLILAAQHDMAWKADEPISLNGGRVCMYFHPASQSRCNNYTDMGLYASPACFSLTTPDGHYLTPRCEYIGLCTEREHVFGWEGHPGGGVGMSLIGNLKDRPLQEGMTLREMYASTGQTRFAPNQGMPAGPAAVYSRHLDAINGAFEEKRRRLDDQRQAALQNLLSRFGPMGKVFEIGLGHCCNFDPATRVCLDSQSFTDEFDGATRNRLPCEGANMQCNRVGGFIRSIFSRSQRASCVCANGFLYDHGRRACDIPDTIAEEHGLEEWYSTEMVVAGRERDAARFLLGQTTDFGVPDREFGGSVGAWRCSMSGDASWQLSFAEQVGHDLWR